MTFFDGLYSYEIVLLLLGCVLFVAILFAFLLYVIRGKAFGRLLVFFVLPIAMIGYPSLQSIEYSNGVFKVNVHTHELQNNPTNTALRASLFEEVAKLSPRPSTNPNTLTTIAGAQIALGKDQEAQANVNKALRLAPQNTQARELQERLTLDKQLTDLTTRVQQQPGNIAAKAELQRAVAKASSRSIASPVTITNVARAQATLGEHAQAQANVEKALKIDPRFSPAIQLKSKIPPPHP